ncbi:MAG: energy coupling factor transporter S component ThiW [Nitrososphaerota archaeon]|nr:energy coupling factor transporter S component ThiW [Nitrososphaerota archaeon]
MIKSKTLRKLVLSALLSALALAVSPFAWFQWGPTKAFPGQHMVNVLAGIMVGPLWASLCAIIVGTLRIMLGLGTVFAYPGGIPGGLMVGAVYLMLKKRIGGKRAIVLASLFEPIGTVLIGGTISWYIVDPFFGSVLYSRFGAILPLYLGWALSSVSGCLIGTLLILALDRLSVIKNVVD